jgi:hypothetical protein
MPNMKRDQLIASCVLAASAYLCFPVELVGQTATGGSATGGSATSSSGTATGGSATGGSATATGGSATATGGSATGGSATSGTVTGATVTRGTTTHGTSVVNVNGREIKASGSAGASIEANDSGTSIRMGAHVVKIERDRVLLDGKERATLPAAAAKIQVDERNGRLTIRADGRPVLSEKVE